MNNFLKQPLERLPEYQLVVVEFRQPKNILYRLVRKLPVGKVQQALVGK